MMNPTSLASLGATDRRRDVLVPAGLVLLSTVPSVVGVVRLLGIALDRPMLPDHERLTAHPVPLVIHIVSATTFAVLGALQFAPSLRRRRFHRNVGRVLAPLGIAAAASGMWLAFAYPTGAEDSPLLRALRFAAGSAIIAFIARGLLALRRRDFVGHGAWMLRGYAVAVAAGTQFFTVLPYVLLVDVRSETVSALLMGAGWAINLAVAEWSIRRRSTHALAVGGVA